MSAPLPKNIERRIYRHGYQSAPYRGWDSAGRFYFIAGRNGAWRAVPREQREELGTLHAPTLERMSTLLSERA
jgi:hypothetical protein